MCLNPKYIPIATRFRRRYQTYHHAFVDCNNCPECFRKRRNHYMLRNHFETLATLQKGGFVLLDTLTYMDDTIDYQLVWSRFSPVSLPHLNYTGHSRFVKNLSRTRSIVSRETGEVYSRDIRLVSSKKMVDSHCEYLYRVNMFNYEHIKKFWKRLRINIERDLSISVKDSLRYFAVPEFGRSKGRPHWHVALYSTVPDLSPDLLKRYVNKSWRGIPIDSPYYNGWSKLSDKEKDEINFSVWSSVDMGATDLYSSVEHNTIRDIHSVKHIRYVTKYVLKDSSVDSELCKLFFVRFPSQLPNELHQYIRCSVGFGSLERCSDSRLLPSQLRLSAYYHPELEKITLPYDSSDGQQHRKLVDEYPLTQYYLRRKYYDTVKLSDGSYTSQPNSNYAEYKIKHIEDMHTNVKNTLSLHLRMIELQYPDEYEEIKKLLEGFSLEDFATFCLLLVNRDISASSFDLLPDGLVDINRFIVKTTVGNCIESISDKPFYPSVMNRNSFKSMYKPLTQALKLLKKRNCCLSDYYTSQYKKTQDYQSMFKSLLNK